MTMAMNTTTSLPLSTVAVLLADCVTSSLAELSHPRPPPPPQHKRSAERDDARPCADPERGPPARLAHARGVGGRDVARCDERVEVGVDGRADEGGVGHDAEVAREVLQAPDGREDAGAAVRFLSGLSFRYRNIASTYRTVNVAP